MPSLARGLGAPSKALNIAAAGVNEHFSGVNAGTMFGDGVYFAEDMGKSDQYCAPHAAAPRDDARRRLDALLFAPPTGLRARLVGARRPPPPPDDDLRCVVERPPARPRSLENPRENRSPDSPESARIRENPRIWLVRYAFVCRVVLGAFVQVGARRAAQLDSAGESAFAAGTRELAVIPGLATPTHFHAEIAEIAPTRGVAPDTHTERGGSALRFREMVVFHPTLVYPEYLVAYRRVQGPLKKRSAV